MDKFIFIKSFFMPDEMRVELFEGRAYYPVWVPAVDIYEDNEAFTVEAELPGVSEEDINIKIEDNILQISGIRRTTAKFQRCHMLEREQGYFLRKFILSSEVDTNGIKASLKDGILTIVIPKAEAKRVRVSYEED